MYFIVCPHCRRQLKLARSGAEFPSGMVTCRYCCATFSAKVLETPDDAPMATAEEIYEHLRVEYDSSHLYVTYGKTSQTDDQMPEIVSDISLQQTPAPEFSTSADGEISEQHRVAAFAAKTDGSDDMETPAPKIGKRPEEIQSSPKPVPVPKPAESAEPAAVTPSEPTPVPVPIPVPVQVKKTQPKVAQTPSDQSGRPREPIELKEEEVVIDSSAEQSQQDPIDALSELSSIHDKPDAVKFDDMPRQPVVLKRKKTSYVTLIALLLVIAGCIYGIYFGVNLFIQRYKKNEQTKAKIEEVQQAQFKKKAAVATRELIAEPELELDIIDNAEITQFKQIPSRQPGEPTFYTGKFRSGPNTPLEIARIELTLSDFTGQTKKLKSDVYKNIPADSEIMFSVMSDVPVTEDMSLERKTVTGKKALSGTLGWNIDKYSRENNEDSIHIFGHTRNNTELTVKNIYIWCDFFTRDGFFAGSAKGTIPAEVLELAPGKTVTYNIVFDLDSSTALMPETVQFVRPRLTGKAGE